MSLRFYLNSNKKKGARERNTRMLGDKCTFLPDQKLWTQARLTEGQHVVAAWQAGCQSLWRCGMQIRSAKTCYEFIWNSRNADATLIFDEAIKLGSSWVAAGLFKSPYNNGAGPAAFNQGASERGGETNLPLPSKSHFILCNVHTDWRSQSMKWEITKWPNFCASRRLVRLVDGDVVGGLLMRGMNHDVTLGRERERGRASDGCETYYYGESVNYWIQIYSVCTLRV